MEEGWGPFPRSKERGLIEVDVGYSTATCTFRFPRSKERGLIEVDSHHHSAIATRDLSAFERARPH